jgi:hypothetical protein
MWRILIAAMVAVAVMVAVKDGRLLRDAGLTGSCTSVAPPAGQTGYWKLCTRGKLDGRPDLTRQGCKAGSLSGKTEWWRCPAAIGSALGT